MTMDENPFRLPRAAVPSRYDLTLTPDLQAAKFTGEVDIELSINTDLTELVCNALDLAIEAAHVRVRESEDTEALVAATWTSDERSERLTLQLSETVEAGSTATLHLEFTGTLNDKLRGFYRSTYTDGAGATQVIATTQMQATDCRRAFPCWDEPDLKAVFGVTLVVDADLLAISNAPELSRTTLDNGKVAVKFADTMVMSTYLVAFIVGRLEATEPIDVGGTPLRVVHLPGKTRLTGFAQDIGAFALQWFQDYYGIPYPGEKVDLVALPDFAAGAMENLGCITFRENLLLVDADRATQQEEQLVADVTAHELAHMWFGDLVTMRWWNGIWLNEAFATFMEVAACDAFRPAWKRWVSFSLERSAAFDIDGLLSTRPVEFEVISPDDADGMFDVLTYEKGGALLRMLQQFLGPDRFRDGIRHYLTTHSYGNTDTEDLWDALEHTSGEPVRRIMDSWIWQGGHPLVSAFARDGEVVVNQRRFLYAGEDDGTRWVVPVHVRQHGSSGDDDRWLLLEDDETTVPLIDPHATVVVNAGADSFFRVNYEPALLARLTGPALASLSTSERYALVDDAWAAVVTGALGADDFVTFARGFGDERDLPVWQVLLGALRWCDRFVEGEVREQLRGYVRALVGPALQRLGWEPTVDEDDLTGELRSTLIRALAVLGNDFHAQDRARELFEQAERDPSSVDPEVAAAAIAVVAAIGNAADHEHFVERFRATDNPQEKLRYLYALADFPGIDEIHSTLEFAFSGEVRTQNAPFLLNRCIAHREHGATSWRFVREHWTEANERFPQNTIIRMVDTVRTLTEPEQQADVAGFFAEHPIPQSAKTLEQVLERQKVNVALHERAGADLAEVFPPQS
jgi:puromycin-sensitive aminopeptidase